MYLFEVEKGFCENKFLTQGVWATNYAGWGTSLWGDWEIGFWE